MQDIVSGDLTLIVHRDNRAVLTKKIPSAWFPLIHKIYLNDTSEFSYLIVIDQLGNEYRLESDPSDPVIDSNDPNQISQRVYAALLQSRKDAIEAENNRKKLEEQRIENERTLKENEKRSLEEAKKGLELLSAELIENQKKYQSEADAKFQEMIEQQRQAELEVIRLQQEKEDRYNNLIQTLLPKLKQDPTTVLEVLESEIIELESVQVAVAEAIDSSDKACELVIKSPEHLWTNNFIIMRSIIIKVTYNKNLAQMIGNVFPPDHLLINMLNKVGR